MLTRKAAALLLGFCLSAFCEDPASPSPGTLTAPVEAELLKPLNVRSLAIGANVFARVTRDWNGPGCNLRQGATLEATVQLAETHKGRAESKLALAFTRAQCGGADMQPMELLLSAVAHVPENWENTPSGPMSVPVSFVNPTSFGNRGGSVAASRPARAPVIPGGFYSWHMELRGVNHHFPMSAKVQPGDVIDIKGTKLDLGTGPNQSSVLSAKRSDVRLDQYTQFLLVPSSLAFGRSEMPLRLPPGSAELSDRERGQTNPSALRATNDIEVCAPPGCAVDLPVTSAELQGPSATSIEVRPLGYTPRSIANLSDFTDDEAVAWLGSEQLVFAFNTHRLIRREGIANWKATHRIIRAVLFDAQSRTVTRAVDWEVMDSNRFLWPLSGGRVLVHVGNELRVYRAGLDVEQTIPLAGPLQFICMAPNLELMAVATLRERHSPELHSKLRDDLGAEPEEDVDIAILNEKFSTIAQASTVTGIEPPTLLNEGQVTLFAQPNNHYRLGFSSWEGKSSTFARFESSCRPGLSSMMPDHLFLVTCDAATGRFEYRVLGSDGKLLMHGEGNQFVASEEASGSESNGVFAIKAIHSGQEFIPGMDFKGADMAFEELRVYRAADGKRLLAVHVKEPTTSRGGYALSPDGSRLAVLSQALIQFFQVPKP
ncbi:exported hypothetical protein [Candidatus Sulfotelmatomonas gaucii]|uniref:Lipoprotein n=1 Tax=Candidatus Sulfuritelmatomonas gaucii TaxID=2043161 RepID=A0A2N9M2Q0_9BACT|nr:exported hypothetical protein [Candidatus Sulfotelmatomonas gaucii]